MGHVQSCTRLAPAAHSEWPSIGGGASGHRERAPREAGGGGGLEDRDSKGHSSSRSRSSSVQYTVDKARLDAEESELSSHQCLSSRWLAMGHVQSCTRRAPAAHSEWALGISLVQARGSREGGEVSQLGLC